MTAVINIVPNSRATAVAILAAAAFVSAPQASVGERAKADVECSNSAQQLTYDCTIRLSRRGHGTPLGGARIVIKADMANMPMAHNVAPVVARESATPGSYLAKLALEMPGRWTLRLQISGPLGDIVVTHVDFGLSPGHVRTLGAREIKGYADPRDRRAVSRGRQVYAANCARCHGPKQQGERRAGLTPPPGEKPAPPLNGSGHSAHHGDGDMFTTVRGSPAPGSRPPARRMPRFGSILSEADIWAVLAYIKSRWPEVVRRHHAERYPRRD